MGWEFIGSESGTELVKLHHFVALKKQGETEVEFAITVREHAVDSGAGPLRFFAQSDKQTNQSTGPYTPTGWGPSLEAALAACIKEINRFPYEPGETG